MNAIERFFYNIRHQGVSGYLAERIRMFLGLNQYSDNIGTIFFFLNKCIKPSELPPTEDPDLRIMQNAIQCFCEFLINCARSTELNIGLIMEHF